MGRQVLIGRSIQTNELDSVQTTESVSLKTSRQWKQQIQLSPGRRKSPGSTYLAPTRRSIFSYQ